jgi:hypothetical protein
LTGETINPTRQFSFFGTTPTLGWVYKKECIMHTHFEEIATRHFSPKLWRGFSSPLNLGPSGGSYNTPSGNPCFGFFDDFLTFNATTLVGPYANLLTAGCTAALAADTANEKGVLALAIDGNAANDEAVLKWGGTLSAPFKLGTTDLAFECRLAVSAITASKWSWAVGLGAADMITTDLLFVDTTGALADKSFLGFNKLYAEAGGIDGAYKAAGQTYQNGATKTKLDLLHTAVATTYVKLGFRYHANPRSLEWYVNGSVPGGNIAPARVTATEIDAVTFPDDAFLAPIIGIKDIAGNAVLSISLDWWACAQYE